MSDTSSWCYFKLSSRSNFNRSLSVSVTLMAIAQANWEVEATATVSTEADKRTGWWRHAKSEVIAFVLSLALSVDGSRHSLSRQTS